MRGTIDNAIRLLEANLPNGAYIEDISVSTSYGSRDDSDKYKEGVGSYRRHFGDAWCVDVYTDGWEYEREHWLQWGHSIREACLKLAWSFRKVRRNPHLQHLGIEGPGDVTFEAYFLRSCPECVREAEDIFDGKVDWQDDAA